MGKRRNHGWGAAFRGGAETATGGVVLTFGLFVVIFVGLFLMLVAGACADVGVDYALGSEDTFERIAGPVICLVCAVVGAALAATALSIVTALIASGYRAVLTTYRAVARMNMAGVFALTGLGTLAAAVGIGGWRLSAGYADGQPHWVMQGTVIAAVGGLVGLLLLPAALALALERPRPGCKGGAEDETSADEESGAEWTFTFLAVLGFVASMAVVDYVGLARQLEGRGPLPLGDYVDLAGRHAELTLPPDLEGRHAIIMVGSFCTHTIVDDEDTPIEVKHVPKKVDADGDTERLGRLVFEAEEDRRYRVRIGEPVEPCTCADDDFACAITCASQEKRDADRCPYAVRLVKE